MRNYKFFLALCGILFLAGILLTIASLQKNPPTKPIVPIASQTLSSEAYKKMRNELVAVMLKQNPKIALTLLAEKMKSDDSVARSCHALTHEIGQNAYQQYKDFGKAMQYQNEICNSGYLHGVIESNFAQSADIFSGMQTICSEYSPQSFVGWECYHGVGHGLMYFTENLLPRSLSLCETYKNNDARSACTNGVFMENFNTDQKLHHSRFLKSFDPMYPCREQKTQNKADCYLYAPTYYLSLHKNEYQKGFTWCKTAEKNFQSTCIGGMGSQIMKENSNNPKLAESICMQAEKRDQGFCIEGMVGLSINHFGGVEETKKLCSTLEKSNKPICEQVVASKESLF